MELSKDYEFLSAALTAVSGDLVLVTKVPGPNTKVPDRYNADYFWLQSPDRIYELNSISKAIRTGPDRTHGYCPKLPEPKIGKEITLFVKLVTGKTIQVSIKNSCWVLTLKEKIQDKEGIPPGQQRLMT